ncbi:PEP-CTERM sorting domain-containing protein [Phormidium sp. LEGE 05292]|uniref:choice-of-anchor L family PEP-CTERM protein n=1 Tax=[Phormidium] sp. LEGE 05292 TaxID=767427 RepID=UPI00187F2A86|nr:choice-of-anchor L domain-containing protein [Phormidium sp. LEGE 05292]MBE9226401.1 PEP-CTERM sorting domain-containing protein [Phormidium sp. LEGE 05292]
MKLLQKAASAIATTAALSIAGVPAMAFTVNQDNNGSNLLNALLGTTNGLSNFSVTTTGNAAAFGLFSGDPFGLDSGIVLSSGKVADIPGVNSAGTDLSTSFGTLGDTPGSYDLAKLDISFDADSTADKVFFQYVFGSEEFVEWAGSSYNDSFELLLNGVNLAKLSDGKTVTINNLATSPSGPFHADYINNPAGPGTVTKLDGYTKGLTFEGLLNKNAKNTLSIKIKDVADGGWDSAVFLKGGTLGTVNPEAVPEPGTVLGLLAVGGMAFLKGRKQQREIKG